MKNLGIPLAILLIAASPAGATPEPAASAADAPLNVAVSVAPQAVSAGAETSVTVRLDPKPGIKLNKYPKIKLQVPAVSGLVAAAEISMGNSAPPPADQLEANYFHGSVDPLTVTLRTDAAATKGRHDLHAKLSYFYCVAASGYCAPAKADVTIPLTVR